MLNWILKDAFEDSSQYTAANSESVLHCPLLESQNLCVAFLCCRDFVIVLPVVQIIYKILKRLWCTVAFWYVACCCVIVLLLSYCVLLCCCCPIVCCCCCPLLCAASCWNLIRDLETVVGPCFQPIQRVGGRGRACLLTKERTTAWRPLMKVSD